MGITEIEPPAGSTLPTWDGGAAVYDATYRMLLRVAFQITGSGPAAEDVVHDVICAVGPRLATLDNPPAYLRVAVVNRCRTVHRRSSRAPQLEPPADLVADAGLSEFRHELMQLSLKRRTAIVLRYLCDLSDAQIAEAMSCREATVRSLVRRGLADLREHLTSENDPHA